MARIAPPSSGNHLALGIKFYVERPVHARIRIDPEKPLEIAGEMAEAVPHSRDPPGLHFGDLAPVIYTSIKVQGDRQTPCLFSGGRFYFQSWQFKPLHRPFPGYDCPVRMVLSG